MRKLWRTSKVKTGEGEYQINNITYAKGGGTSVYMCAQGGMREGSKHRS